MTKRLINITSPKYKDSTPSWLLKTKTYRPNILIDKGTIVRLYNNYLKEDKANGKGATIQTKRRARD